MYVETNHGMRSAKRQGIMVSYNTKIGKIASDYLDYHLILRRSQWSSLFHGNRDRHNVSSNKKLESGTLPTVNRHLNCVTNLILIYFNFLKLYTNEIGDFRIMHLNACRYTKKLT